MLPEITILNQQRRILRLQSALIRERLDITIAQLEAVESGIKAIDAECERLQIEDAVNYPSVIGIEEFEIRGSLQKTVGAELWQE